MVNAQEWLDKNYPDKETHIIYLNQQLEGILDCSEYKDLWTIFISSQIDRSKFEIKKGSYNGYKGNEYGKHETKIIPCVSAQTWLDENYPKDGTCVRKQKKWNSEEQKYEGEEENHQDFGKTREVMTHLDISAKGLEGPLDLSDFSNLEYLDCSDNCLTKLNLNNCRKLKNIKCSKDQLTTLTLSNLEKLEVLNCYDNYLTQIIYPSNPEKITWLEIQNNNLSLSDLSIFSRMRNLERLIIGNSDKNKISKGIYNKIEGSLGSLKDLNKLERLIINNTDIKAGWEHLPASLKYFWYNTRLRPNYKLAQIYEQWDQAIWKDIHEDFAPKYKEDWLAAGFSKEQTREILEGKSEWSQMVNEPKPEHGAFINWFLNFKKLDLTWAKENEEEFKEWRDKYKNFEACEECQQPNTSQLWCNSCNVKHFQAEFKNWTSGNKEIDTFIQRCQLEATSAWNVLEWIPYEQFANIEHIADGGFGQVYKAKWEGGSIWKWDNEKGEWERSRDYDGYDENTRQNKFKNYKTVALKTLSNSQNLNQAFLKELTLYKMFKSEVSNMVPCYGISKNLEGNYIMVMEYMSEGNLRGYLKKNRDRELEFYNICGNSKLSFLKQIIQGLKDIHRKKLVHRDFHSGNVVVNRERIWEEVMCRITDLGLSKPAHEEEKEGEIYGLLPYVAPEVLVGRPYTQASDVYSLGMIMYEILTGLPPYAEYAHDLNLSLKICRGERPKFPEQVKYPQLLIDLIKKCWDNEPNNRPTSRKASEIVREWLDKNNILKQSTQFYQQYQEAKEHNKNLPDEIRYPIYQSDEVWHSKPINTKEITTKLQEYYASGDLELNLDKLNIQDEQGEGSLQSHIQIPPKDSEELLKEDVLSKNEGEANKEIQEINKELEKVEKQLRSYYENSETGLKETIKEFIETNKEFARNQENDEARENAAKIYEELKKKMSFEKIEQIIENCEKLVGFELLLNESKKNETQLKAQQIYPPK